MFVISILLCEFGGVRSPEDAPKLTEQYGYHKHSPAYRTLAACLPGRASYPAMWQLRLCQFQFVVAFLSVSTCLVRCQTLNESVCTLGGWTHDLRNEAKQFGIGVIHIPRAMVRPTNVRWELPIAADHGCADC